MNKYAHPILLFILVSFTLFACGGGGGSTPQPTPPFSQADLGGAWYFSILQSSPALSISSEPGWIRGTAGVDNTGRVTITSFFTSATGTVAPDGYPRGMVWTIDPWSGLISESSGTYANPDFHGKLASNKTLIVGTATNQNGTSNPKPVQFRVMQKIASNATYTADDIRNRSFSFHQIESGAGGIWTRATGSTDGDAKVSFGVFTNPTGTFPGGSPGVLSMNSEGLVSLNSNTSFQGMLSPDKSYIVATETDRISGNIYRLTIVQMTGQTLTTSDMAGSWHFHGVIGGIPAWVYQSISIDDAANATITSQQDSLNNAGGTGSSASAQLNIDESGDVTHLPDPSFHGTFSPGKDMLVSTQTISDVGGPYYMLGVTIK